MCGFLFVILFSSVQFAMKVAFIAVIKAVMVFDFLNPMSIIIASFKPELEGVTPLSQNSQLLQDNALFGLTAHNSITPQKTRINLVKSLLIPHFTYCHVIFFHGLDSVQRRTIQRALDGCEKYAFALRCRDSVDKFKTRILWV